MKSSVIWAFFPARILAQKPSIVSCVCTASVPNREFCFNPTEAERLASDLALTVASTKDKVIMIEAGANEVSDEIMIDAIYKAHDINKQIIAWMDQIVADVAALIADGDTYKKAARQYYVKNAALEYHDQDVYDYFEATFPDLFD